MTAFMVVFSTYFTFLVPTGVALYWIVGNLSAIVVMHLCNIVYDPRKYIDYESRPKRVHQGKDERAKEKQRRVENHNREKADNRRFYADEDNVKQLVFYSAKSGFYKYFENTIDYILAHSDVVIHYVTSDEYDQIFEKNHPRIETYYIGYKALIPFMMKMDADMVVMTMPDLGKYYIKRSLVRKDVEYVYMFHGLASVHMTSRENAHDNFDTLLCVGQHQIDELRALEKEYSLKPRNLIPCGYGLIDNLIASYNAMEKQPLEKKRILVAPSWQQDNIMESCLGPLLEQLFLVDAQVVVRPHPEFIKRFPEKMNLILAQYQSHLSENFMIETDFSSNSSIFTADLLVTDWSGIAFEFSYATKKPSLFINTPMKVMNPEYKKIPLVPLDISLRDEVGVSVDLENIDNVSKIVYELLNHQQDYIERISALVEKNVFNIGHSGEAGGAYILEQLRVKREERKHADDSL
jgi:YidC/Oxa1 family membrane protein insertase